MRIVKGKEQPYLRLQSSALPVSRSEVQRRLQRPDHEAYYSGSAVMERVLARSSDASVPLSHLGDIQRRNPLERCRLDSNKPRFRFEASAEEHRAAKAALSDRLHDLVRRHTPKNKARRMLKDVDDILATGGFWPGIRPDDRR